MVIMSIFLILMFIVFGYGIADLITGKMKKEQISLFFTATMFVSFFMYIFLEI